MSAKNPFPHDKGLTTRTVIFVPSTKHGSQKISKKEFNDRVEEPINSESKAHYHEYKNDDRSVVDYGRKNKKKASKKRHYRVVLKHGRGKFRTSTIDLTDKKQVIEAYKGYQEIYGKKEPSIQTYVEGERGAKKISLKN